MSTYIAWVLLLVDSFISSEWRLLGWLVRARVSVGVLLWSRLLRHRPHFEAAGLMPGVEWYCESKLLDYVTAEGLLH